MATHRRMALRQLPFLGTTGNASSQSLVNGANWRHPEGPKSTLTGHEKPGPFP